MKKIISIERWSLGSTLSLSVKLDNDLIFIIHDNHLYFKVWSLMKEGYEVDVNFDTFEIRRFRGGNPCKRS